MKVYKIIHSKDGFAELEKKVNALLKRGWEPLGGISFNHGFAYQAMIGNVEIKKEGEKTPQPIEENSNPVGANEGFQRIDELI